MRKDKRVPIELCEKSDMLGILRVNIYSVGNNCEPWTSRELIYVLDHILNRKMNGLEWSCGSSTVWLAYRLSTLISIENSAKWRDSVKNKIHKLNITSNIDLLFIDNDNISYCKNDREYISSNGLCFKSYAINSYITNKKFDYISIDGRARNGCIITALKVIKPENGIITIDNSERTRYKKYIDKIPKWWKRYDFSYQLGRATLFITKKKNN